MADADVTQLNPAGEAKEFFEFLYGDVTGWVYSPVKAPEDADWTQNFFEWPRESTLLVDHCSKFAGTHEVYVGPALYRKASGKKEDLKGTNVLWAEFDGQTPSAQILGDLPSPSRRVRSSEDGHEHWYWRLDEFLGDIDAIENANRGLTYSLGADTSGWDANQVLRPPSTYNHKRGKPVLTLIRGGDRYSSALFQGFEPTPNLVGSIEITELPDALLVISKYQWPAEEFAFFRKPTIEVGKRSSAMMRLAHVVCEMRMQDAEAYSILLNADERWGKFKGRRDKERRLTDLINKARLKHPFESVPTDDEFPTFDFNGFLATDMHVEWIIEGILQKAGYLLLSGPAGCGKTQLSLRFAMGMAMGEPVIGYSAGRPMKITMFSMEMGHADLKYFLSQMAEGLTDEQRALLSANFNIVPLGYGVLLDQANEQRKVERYLDRYQPDGIIFDSLGSTTTDELSSEATVKKIMDWNDRIRADRDIFTWFIHHNRKAQGNNKKPNKLSDVYGSMYITARATTVLGVWPHGDDIEVSALKVRLSALPKPFNITRLPGLNFKRSEPGKGLITKVITDTPEELKLLSTEPDGPVAHVDLNIKAVLDDF